MVTAKKFFLSKADSLHFSFFYSSGPREFGGHFYYMLSTELFSFFFSFNTFFNCEALLIIFNAFTSNGLKTTTTSKRNIPYSNKKWNYMGFCSQAQKVQVCHMIARQSLRVEGLSINFQLLLFVVRWSMAMQISRNKRIFYMRKEFNHHSILLVSLRSRRRKR